jgi:hypothetical protein
MLRYGRVHRTHFNRANVCVLRNVLVLIEAVFGRFAFPQVDAEFDEEEHDRLQGGDRTIPGPLGGDMFVQYIESGLGLINCDEFLRSL